MGVLSSFKESLIIFRTLVRVDMEQGNDPIGGAFNEVGRIGLLVLAGFFLIAAAIAIPIILF